MIAPCKDCEKRHINCHSECPEYKLWKIYEAEEKRKIKKLKGELYCSRRIHGMSRTEYLARKGIGKLK